MLMKGVMLKVRHAKFLSYALQARRVAPVASVTKAILTNALSTQALARPRVQQMRPAKVKHTAYADSTRSLTETIPHRDIHSNCRFCAYMLRCRA
jgi:hypothetical protein